MQENDCVWVLVAKEESHEVIILPIYKSISQIKEGTRVDLHEGAILPEESADRYGRIMRVLSKPAVNFITEVVFVQESEELLRGFYNLVIEVARVGRALGSVFGR